MLDLAEEQRALWKTSGHNLDAFLRDRPELGQWPGFRLAFQRFLYVLNRAENLLEQEEIEALRTKSSDSADEAGD